MNEPYAGIDWTGEAVDTRWAALGDGAYPHVDAPDYDGDDVIGYALEPVDRAADAVVVWLLNGLATIRVYGRFYAGGAQHMHALDAAAGYHFAATRADELDLSRLGGFGMSWADYYALRRGPRPRRGAPARARGRGATERLRDLRDLDRRHAAEPVPRSRARRGVLLALRRAASRWRSDGTRPTTRAARPSACPGCAVARRRRARHARRLGRARADHADAGARGRLPERRRTATIGARDRRTSRRSRSTMARSSP